MSDSSPAENDFLNQLKTVVEKNISNEQFGVSELADEMNMSRSNLLRKVKKLTNLSVSQLIRDIRLAFAMDLLRKSSLNVSEVSHQVGFSSTSYFIKCFREQYGYPPGEVGKHDTAVKTITDFPIAKASSKRGNFFILGAAVLVIVLVVGLLFYFKPGLTGSTSLEKSIVVLPFKNESNDSSNVYLINGLMESTLNNLQQIKELKVLSRTSAEKYRNSSKSIPEMAKELKATYFVEGSGQKIGDRILLNIQLIDGVNDKHLWAKQYRRETKDIFELQQEIAKNIAAEIQVIITPDEENRIKKIPTDNIDAYDLYLKGKDLFYQSTAESLQKSIPYFKKAIDLDNEFGLAYANATMVFYYLDIFRIDKKYGEEISDYADKALLFDPKSGESLVAKGLSYAYKAEYKLAVPYLERALEYNPHSGIVIHFLTEFYSIHVPNPSKYLEYAIKGATQDSVSADSVTRSFKYFHLSNALIQAGFVDESIKYINKSVAYDPHSPFAVYVRALFMYAKDNDIKKARDLVIKEWKKDTTRADIAKEVAKLCYTDRDYKSAYTYYKKFIALKEIMQLVIYKEENISIAVVMDKVGEKQKAKEYAQLFKDFADKDLSIYKPLHLAMYYSYIGDAKKALEYLAIASKEENYQYWILLFENDPVVDSIKELPEFKKLMKEIKDRFWATHEKIKRKLEEEKFL
ncbi:MAG TPA: helix-turn-helix domain-containing protein [Cyclobacteriaceae bacterium]